MPGPAQGALSRLLPGHDGRRPSRAEQLYADLRTRAHLVGQRAGSTLQPTALVHEAWLRLVPNRSPSFTDRNHFLRAAVTAMRSVLVDHPRALKSQ